MADGPILAIDPGTHRVGLARCDLLRISSTPLPAMKVDHRFPATLIDTIREENYSIIVIGHPVNQDGKETPMSLRAKELGETIEKETGLLVFLQNERHSTREVIELLQEKNFRKDKIQKMKDSLSAMVILQWFLDEHPGI